PMNTIEYHADHEAKQDADYRYIQEIKDCSLKHKLSRKYRHQGEPHDNEPRSIIDQAFPFEYREQALGYLHSFQYGDRGNGIGGRDDSSQQETHGECKPRDH